MALSVAAFNRCFSLLRVSAVSSDPFATFSTANLAYAKATAAKKSASKTAARSGKASTATSKKKPTPAKKVDKAAPAISIDLSRKRSPTAYNLFMSDRLHRPDKKPGDKDPDFRNKFTQAAQEFGKLADHEKQKYIEKAVELRTTYLEQKKAETKPKRARTAFNYYVKDVSADRPKDMKQPEYLKGLFDKFKALGDTEKEVYLKLQEKDKERAKQEKDAWIETHPIVKSPPNSYNLFVQEWRKTKGKNVEGADMLKKASEVWGKMSADQKKPYQDRALKLRAEYLAKSPAAAAPASAS